MKPRKVFVHWKKKTEADWHHFLLLGTEGQLIHLQGIADPVTKVQHIGHTFWCSLDDIEYMQDVE